MCHCSLPSAQPFKPVTFTHKQLPVSELSSISGPKSTLCYVFEKEMFSAQLFNLQSPGKEIHFE